MTIGVQGAGMSKGLVVRGHLESRRPEVGWLLNMLL